MTSFKVATGDRIVDPMIALAGCLTRQRILVAGSRSMEMMMELQRRGYLRAAATGNCGLPAGQYDVVVRMRDTPRSDGFDHERREHVALATDQMLVIDFREETSEFMFH